MRTNFSKTGTLTSFPWLFALTAAALLSSPFALRSFAQSSPVGTWDCLMSGTRSGVAYLTFSEENGGSFDLTAVIVPNSRSPKVSLLAGDIGTNGLGSNPQPTNSLTQIFGSENVTGTWGFDNKGRVIGHFVEGARSITCTTNLVPVSTNTFESPQPVLETNVIGENICLSRIASTNGIPGVVSNQTICFMNRFPVSSNRFESSTPTSQTNTLADGRVCETGPIFTNAVPFAGTNQTTCFLSDGTPFSTNSSASSIPISQTNRFSDGSFCITMPLFSTNTVFAGVNQITCFINRVAISTNIFASVNLTRQTNSLPDGTFCETTPIFTTVGPQSTFVIQQICFATQLDCNTGLTNQISFRGKVSSGNRINLSCQGTFGNFNIRGVPAHPLIDISGPWYGTKKQQGVVANEFFELSAIEELPNGYQVINGSGPNYTFNGLALLSSQKKLALSFVSLIGTNELTTRAVVGPFNAKKITANTSGIDAADGAGLATNRISFPIKKRSSVP
jgi:hypothetical protein